MADFQSRARAAAASVMSSGINPAEALAQSLFNDRPTIDSAIKAYMSLTAARSLSTRGPSSSGMSVSASASSSIGDAKESLQRTIMGGENNDQQQEPAVAVADAETKCFFVKSKNAQHASLLCARALLKKINSFQVLLDDTPPHSKEESKDVNDIAEESEAAKLEFQVVKIVWNSMVKDENKKPSKLLGRQSLHHIYPLLEESFREDVAKMMNGTGSSINSLANCVDVEEMMAFLHEFGILLKKAAVRHSHSYDPKCNANAATSKIEVEGGDDDDGDDDDSCLLWDVDGGKEELKRRRERRENKANAAKMTMDGTGGLSSAAEGLTIEEITEEDEEEI